MLAISFAQTLLLIFSFGFLAQALYLPPRTPVNHGQPTILHPIASTPGTSRHLNARSPARSHARDIYVSPREILPVEELHPRQLHVVTYAQPASKIHARDFRLAQQHQQARRSQPQSSVHSQAKRHPRDFSRPRSVVQRAAHHARSTSESARLQDNTLWRRNTGAVEAPTPVARSMRFGVRAVDPEEEYRLRSIEEAEDDWSY